MRKTKKSTLKQSELCTFTVTCALQGIKRQGGFTFHDTDLLERVITWLAGKVIYADEGSYDCRINTTPVNDEANATSVTPSLEELERHWATMPAACEYAAYSAA